MRLANLDELYRTGVYEKLKGLRTKKKPEEYPVLISEELSKAKIIFAYLPVYPKWAKNRRKKIEVVLWFQILPKGRVRDNVKIIKSSGYEDVDKLAIEVLKRWLFYPVGKLEKQSGQISFRFNL
jgi:TonB family protein